MASPTLFKLQRLDTRAGPVALVTMDNGEDWQKPNTFGEEALRSLEGVLDRLRTRDWRGLLLTGKPFVFAVGADLDEFGDITPERARLGGEAGHELFGRLRELPFVTVAAINGAALGGGVEIALHCDYRTIATSVRHVAFPEVFLGLVPAWGGTQLVPRLIGAERAVQFQALCVGMAGVGVFGCPELSHRIDIRSGPTGPGSSARTKKAGGGCRRPC